MRRAFSRVTLETRGRFSRGMTTERSLTPDGRTRQQRREDREMFRQGFRGEFDELSDWSSEDEDDEDYYKLIGEKKEGAGGESGPEEDSGSDGVEGENGGGDGEESEDGGDSEEDESESGDSGKEEAENEEDGDAGKEEDGGDKQGGSDEDSSGDEGGEATKK